MADVGGADIEAFSVQNAVIKMQADVIYELLGLLSQHMAAGEMDNLPAVRKINEAAGLRNDLERRWPL